ncbi:MAG: hypothetical protein IKX14_00935, partial [Neisseriaceae bacterium]|nr:hypothetical protein [Neisseriaceae bacterium]
MGLRPTKAPQVLIGWAFLPTTTPIGVAVKHFRLPENLQKRVGDKLPTLRPTAIVLYSAVTVGW